MGLLRKQLQVLPTFSQNLVDRKIGVTVRLRSLNPGKAIAMAICPIICLFYYLARALMYDVACEFACAEGCAETISANFSFDGSFSLPIFCLKDVRAQKLPRTHFF